MIGRTLSHFRITAKLGQGGMGEVYLAEDTELDRKVALKILPQEMAEDPERLERFRREAKAVAALNHPNIVAIYSVEEAEDRRFLIMELVEGDSLDRVLPSDGLPLAKVFDIAIPMADALAFAHEKGIVHRDLKPANVMVPPDGQVKVLDFGLAKLAVDSPSPTGGAVTEAATLTGEGKVMGTAPYMSPEQLQGKTVDRRSDIFSLGIMIYEMVTGRRPFQGESGIDLASSILKDTPSSVTEVRGDLPRHLGRIIAHCLEKDPERRFQSAKDVRNELESLRDEVSSDSVTAVGDTEPGQSTVASAVGATSDVHSGSTGAVPSGPLPQPGASRKGLWVGLAALLALVSLGAWWLGRESQVSTAGGVAEETTQPSAEEGATTEAHPSSVAVLPLADLSAEKDQEYFADGMTEELLQALGKIEGLKVPSRTAVFALKGKELDIQQVGERLGVETVLEGSVRKAGNRLRISTQLVEVSSGFKLWSETYDRELEDVFAVQDEIAGSIADALRLTLSPAGERASELGGTANSEAYDFYLRGQQYRERGTPEAREYSRQMYERAVALDPGYALAWVGLANAHSTLYHVGGADPADLEGANQASAKALALAPDLAHAHAARAVYFERANELEAAEGEFQQAVRLDPKSAQIHYSYGALLYRQGELTRTVELWEKSTELDPDNRGAITILPQLYISLGREEDAMKAYERVVEWATRHLELYPDDMHVRLTAASGLVALGKRDQAFEWIEPVLDSAAGDPLRLYNIACFYSLAGEVDQAIDFLERAAASGKADVEWLRQDSDLDNLRDDPRFQELVERMEARG
ncbi:MAG: protein kinase [Thermoanaerobaculia bacterium]